MRQAFQGLTPMDLFIYLKCWNLEDINVLKTPERFWCRKEIEFIFVIVDNGTLWPTLDQLAIVRNWPLVKNRNRSFAQFCSYYGDCIHHYSDGSAKLTNLCLTSVLGNVVHTNVTKAAVELCKARMISALVFLIIRSDNKAECVVAIVANEIVVVEVLL